jgi:hypothetical protein
MSMYVGFELLTAMFMKSAKYISPQNPVQVNITKLIYFGVHGVTNQVIEVF